MSLCSWLYTPKCANKVGLSPQSLRGPRGGMIFFRKDPVLGVDLESAINNAVFPGLQVSILTWLGSKMKIFVHIFSKMLGLLLQGGPHNHTIGGLAVCLKYAQSPEFKAYQNKVMDFPFCI